LTEEERGDAGEEKKKLNDRDNVSATWRWSFNTVIPRTSQKVNTLMAHAMTIVFLA
jgi:hypothetical protein